MKSGASHALAGSAAHRGTHLRWPRQRHQHPEYRVHSPRPRGGVSGLPSVRERHRAGGHSGGRGGRRHLVLQRRPHRVLPRCAQGLGPSRRRPHRAVRRRRRNHFSGRCAPHEAAGHRRNLLRRHTARDGCRIRDEEVWQKPAPAAGQAIRTEVFGASGWLHRAGRLREDYPD